MLIELLFYIKSSILALVLVPIPIAVSELISALSSTFV